MPILSEVVTLFATVSGGGTGKFPRARLFNAAGAALTEDPLDLTHVTGTIETYSGTFAMPNSPYVVAEITSYDDAGHITVTPGQAKGQAVYRLENDIGTAGVEDAVWDADKSTHTTVGTSGEALSDIADQSKGRKRINTSNASQWVEEVYDDENEATLVATYNLLDQNGAAISNTNNPLVDPSNVFIAEREPV